MRKKLLYVEDDPVQASLVQPFLEDEGYAVYHACSAVIALDVLAESRFELVLTDYYMPGMNGVELLERIQAAKYDIPVVVMTAANEVSLAFTALKAGASDFIAKDSEANYLDLIGPVLERVIRQHTLKAETAALTAQLEHTKQISYKTLDALTQGVLVLDESLRITFCNRSLRSLFRASETDPLASGDLKLLASMFASQGTLESLAEPRKIREVLAAWLAGEGTQLEAVIGHGTFQVTRTPLEGSGQAITLTDITHQKAQLSALDTIVAMAPVAMLAVNGKGQIVLANQKAGELIAEHVPNLVGNSVNRYVHAEFHDRHQSLIRDFFQNPSSRQMRGGRDLHLVNAKGQSIPVEIALNPVEIYGAPAVLVTIVDITHRKEAEKALQQAFQLTQSIVDNAPFSIMATDVEGRIMAVSPAMEKMLGFGRSELIARGDATSILQSRELEIWAAQLSDELGISFSADFSALVAKAQRGIVQAREWTYTRKDGSTLPVNLTITTLQSTQGAITGYLLIAYDITEQKRAQAHIEHVAHHDGLTGLPNRSLMLDRLSGLLLRMQRFNGKIAVIMMDLDHFKQVNDNLGHLAGDQLLITVAERLQRVVRQSDTVCRMGGDEFVLVLPDMESVDSAQNICRKILKQMAQPVSVGLHTLTVTPSIGVCVAPDHGMKVDELLKCADIAMYQAKQAGRNGFRLFSPELAQSNLETLSVENALKTALDDETIELHYQPQIEIDTGKLVGLEALLRWTDPALGEMSPDQFLPLAETTGLVIPLGEWVLNRACSDLLKLRDSAGSDILMSVNISSRQFEHNDFVATVQDALARACLPPSSLQLELSEALLTSKGEAHQQKLVSLSQLGVKLAIHDFGIGQTSLTYVANSPISTIKIQRQFLAIESAVNVAIVRGIAAIAKGLKITLAAVGIETSRQLDFARDNNCRVVQGHYYAGALPLDSIMRLLKEQRPLPWNNRNTDTP